MSPVQIKICGVTTLEDARACVELGVNMIGFNFYPNSPRYIGPGAVRRIVEAMPSRVVAVGVFVDANPEHIRTTANASGVSCVQLHGSTLPFRYRELARNFRVIRAFSTYPQFRPEEVSLFDDCDVLLDAYHPNLRGGTGLTCDWLTARNLRSSARFLILSGGLTDENVGQAITTVTPHAVDVCSAVESAPGVKNHRALGNFVTAVRTANLSTNTVAP